MRIHKEGYPTLLLMSAIVLLANGAVIALAPSGAWVTIGLGVIILGFFAQFFRHPMRQVPAVPNGVLSPADGTIVAIERVLENEYFSTERLKVSVYMSPWNVHCNRVPFAGTVAYTRYHEGKYLVAFHPKASELNERNTVVFQHSSGAEVLVRQIAGTLARRIVSYMQVGQAVQAGDELGFIKFGSRCDVFLPIDSQIQVQLQQRVVGGVTILAHLPYSARP